ncbi:tripartite tricarboxylate transporter TctB family protein [Celeribacter neptunius]|uniref:Tripartite tricarboxylate transporter TctB family protein n=1 Tax=Celeribacter neptunius TaxID=588602 RepID=A0A1I3U789_9RHOB|nr:tripartite tricarboxylate transporter TctB family protein [Celeribacter neptunius]SFJ79394.1 Tripartite tricarboxylate transporter TctB family protein [Celeribacter neptunius]
MLDRLIAASTSRSGLGALLLFIFAGITFKEVSGLRLGNPGAMGPGYFPAILGGLFVLFGIILSVEAWANPQDRIYFGRMRPVVMLLAGIILFGLLYRLLGGAIAIAALVVVSALAERGRSPRELAGLVAVVVLLVWLIFVVALDLQLNMLPTWGTS